MALQPIQDPNILEALGNTNKVADPDALAFLNTPMPESDAPPSTMGIRTDIPLMHPLNKPQQVAQAGIDAWKGNATRDLPPLAELPIFDEQVGWAEDVKNVFRTPDHTADAFLQKANRGGSGREPQYRKAPDENGNPMIEKKTGDGYEPIAYVNTPGMDWRDVRDTAAQVAPYVLSGGSSAVLTKGMPWIKRALAFGGTEALTEVAVKSATDQAIEGENVAIAVGSGAVSEIPKPFIRTVLGLPSYSKRQLRKATEQISNAGVLNPSENTVKLFAARDAGQINPEYSDNALIVAGETGMPLSKADVMPDRNVEERLAKGKQRAKEAGLKDVPEMSENPNEQLLKQTEYIQDQMIVKNADRPEAQTGHDFINLIKGESDATLAKAEDLYRERGFASQLQMTAGEPKLTVQGMVHTPNRGYQAGHQLVLKNKPIPEIVDLKDRLSTIFRAEQLGDPLNKSTELTKNWINQFNKNVDELVEQGTWTVGNVDNMLRSINKQMRDVKGSDRAIMGQVKNQYKRWVDDVLKPSMDDVEAQSLSDLMQASEIYGGYMRRFGKDNVVGHVIQDIADGNADAQKVIPALFGGQSIDLTGKQAQHLVQLLPEAKQGEMVNLMKEGVFRRIFGSVKTGRPKDSAQAVLEELDALIGKGNSTELGSYLFRSGSKERADLYTVREIMQLVANDDKMKQQATGQALSALYARINTPFGFRVVTALPDWHARLFRGSRARKHLNPLRDVRNPAGLSGAATGAGVQQATKEDEP